MCVHKYKYDFYSLDKISIEDIYAYVTLWCEELC